MDDADKLKARMTVGKMMRDNWEANPPDPQEWIRALTGCAELYLRAADYFAQDPPDWREALACLKPALEAGYEVHGQAMLGYAFSGQATDDFLGKVQEDLGRMDDDTEADDAER